MINVTTGNIKEISSNLVKQDKTGDPFKGKRGTVNVGPKQMALCYRQLLECLFDIKWGSARTAFYKRGLKPTNPCDVAIFIRDRIEKENFITSDEE